MTGAFGAVMERLAAGESPRAAARALGIPLDLAETAAAEGERLGLVIRASAACGTCTPGGSPVCAGCPLAR
ncbi:hypothetical protein QQX09_12120 [Demequina sp. SYSU T00192]|uniref:Uncharacterized protein n=1 Tax=Demequina litoralis TaxID=3051660 RepID=A0ABT8GBT5_9MICO|nr:hypothetical protein [Demequina sp. SYSU T00192]MDN4476603.1 hypothetical protein [Demequina sp. SYSU T00192]